MRVMVSSQLTGDNTKGLSTSSTVAVCLHSSLPPATSSAVSPIKPSFSEADCHVIYAPTTKSSLSANTTGVAQPPPLTSISADNIVLPTRQPAAKLSKYCTSTLHYSLHGFLYPRRWTAVAGVMFSSLSVCFFRRYLKNRCS